MGRLTILYFARVAETIGRDRDEVDVPNSIATLRDLADWIETQGDGSLGPREKLRGAIDQEMAALDTQLGTAKEVAFFPPVTGG
jgi:molybdopterin synthase sulfur carrier subunit